MNQHVEISARREPEARAGQQRADRSTPLIRNCWYVAAWSEEVGQTPFARRILDRNICLYRSLAGAPIALHDRCPHRSMPLSMGYREGDNLRCGYHGLLFGPGGNCLEIPSQEIAPPKTRCVRAYAAVERAPLIWLWTGDPALADEALIPEHDWLADSTWGYAHGSMRLACNYVGLHENLLDLTHFTYLHPGTVGTPEVARAAVETEVIGDTVRATRFIPECDVPGLYLASTGLKERKISRRIDSEFISPAAHSAEQLLTVLKPEPGLPQTFSVRIIHFVTPESQDATHYFFAHGRDFVPTDAAITAAVERAAVQAFSEDAVALEAIARTQASEPGFEGQEFDIKSDAPGIAARRMIKRIAGREAV